MEVTIPFLSGLLPVLVVLGAFGLALIVKFFISIIT
jgi:hypothetical protein